jgi:arylsulfatase A-like enzyme
LDKLASTGLLFSRAYVQYSFCAPSRNSFMSGRRPDVSRLCCQHLLQAALTVAAAAAAAAQTTRVWNFM